MAESGGLDILGKLKNEALKLKSNIEVGKP
jgi:hypothetical protein